VCPVCGGEGWSGAGFQTLQCFSRNAFSMRRPQPVGRVRNGNQVDASRRDGSTTRPTNTLLHVCDNVHSDDVRAFWAVCWLRRVAPCYSGGDGAARRCCCFDSENSDTTAARPLFPPRIALTYKPPTLSLIVTCYPMVRPDRRTLYRRRPQQAS
jgi:hypothetical protein